MDTIILTFLYSQLCYGSLNSIFIIIISTRSLISVIFLFHTSPGLYLSHSFFPPTIVPISLLSRRKQGLVFDRQILSADISQWLTLSVAVLGRDEWQLALSGCTIHPSIPPANLMYGCIYAGQLDHTQRSKKFFLLY